MPAPANESSRHRELKRAEEIHHQGYATAERQLRTLQRCLHAGTKFDKIAGWQLIDLHHPVVEPNLVRRSEFPEGWELLVRENNRLNLEAAPRRIETSPERRGELVAAMARQATHRTLRDLDVSLWDDGDTEDESSDPPLRHWQKPCSPP